MRTIGAGTNQIEWQFPLEQSTNTSAGCQIDFAVTNPVDGRGGLARGSHTVAMLKALIDADVAATATPDIVLVNIGTPDLISGLPTEAAMTTNYAYILDAMHAAWPSAAIYCVTPWRQGGDAAANTLAGWIAGVLATRDWTHAGPDERTVIKAADDGAAATYDGVHYSSAGSYTMARAWRSTLGY